MAWDISTDPKRFDEAIAFFREKYGITRAQFDALTSEQQRRAFTVAGVAQLDVISDVWAALDRAIAEGLSLRAFREAVKEKLEREWAGTDVDAPSRIEIIFRTNVQSAYGAGRYAQSTDPDVLESHPYWVFEAIVDGRTSPICEALDGLVLPANDPAWNGRLPPCHHACRSTIRTISEDEARDLGVATRPPAVKASGGFGEPPTRSTWAPDPKAYPPALWAAYEARQQG